MIFIDKMKNLKIYKRPMYLPTIEGDKKKGSAVLLLTPEYLSSRRLIQSDLLINKLRFQSYYLNPNVSYYINGQVAKGKQMSEYISEMDVIEMYHSLTEMTAEERKKIPDSKFGLPAKRKYPLDTADHVRSAIRFFNYVDKEDEEELAHNIIDRMDDFFDSGEMPKIGKNNRLYQYMNEAAKMPDNIPDDIREYYRSLSDIKYGVVNKGKVITNLSSFDFFKDYKSLSISEIEKYRVGVCWDLVHYEAKWFKDHGYKHESYYIEVSDKDGDLPTHSFLVFYLPNSSKAYYFEKSWGKYAGIEEFDSVKKLTETIMQRHIDAYNSQNHGSEVINKYDASSASLEHITCAQYYKKASGGKTSLQESILFMSESNPLQTLGKTVAKSPSAKLGVKIGKEIAHTKQYATFDSKTIDSYKAAKAVYDRLSDKDKKFVCPGGSFIDSPNLVYRNIARKTAGINKYEPIGFVEVYQVNKSSKSATMVYAVVPEQRRAGIVSMLIAEALNHCINDDNIEELIVKIDKNNKAGMGLAKKYNPKKKIEKSDSIELYLDTKKMINEGSENHLYFYHLVPKGSDVSKGITSLQYQFDHKDENFRNNGSKYLDRMVSKDGWNIYPGRDPESISDRELINGLNIFRGDKNGANRIYMFKFPPYSSMGPQMREILNHKDIYRMDLNDPEVQKILIDIDWGYEGSDTRNQALDREYYENISAKDYFSSYAEKDDKLLFSHMNHIAVIPRDGYIPRRLLTKISTPTVMITERSETIQQHIGNTSQNPELVNKDKENDTSGKAFHKGTHAFKRSPFGKAKLKQGGFQAKKEEKKQREEQIKAEATIFNDKDIFYNKDKFDSGEINLCFITGHSGSGKSTMAGDMEKDGVEKYELDDVISNKEHFTMANFKEYGELIYGFFSGPGKKYYYTAEDVKSGKVKPYREEAYDHDLINDFIAYAIKYAKAHKDKKIVIEGIWLYGFAYKEQLTDYAVYIKGTSALISTLRAAKRDSSDSKGIERVKGFIGRFMHLFGKGQTGPLNVKDSEKAIQQWRKYFSSLPVSESSIEKDKILYFLSTKNMDDERLQPRIPDSALIDNGSEDSTTKRICFCPSINKCLMALSRNIAGQEFYVHVLDLSTIDKSYYKNLLHYPEKDEVPDATITQEVWVLKPVTVKCIGKIKVTKDDGNAYPYYYNGKKAELYGWNWNWIIRYNVEGLAEAGITRATPMKSVLDSNFKANGKKSLSSFKKLPINKENINKYKSSYKNLSHVDEKDAGYIFVDGDKVVAIVAVDQSRGDSGDLANYNWISIIEVAKEYRGYGLAKQLLDIATGELKGDFLTVTYDNEVAIKTYKDYGFRITKNSYERIQNGTEKSHMYTMMYKNRGPKGIQLIEDVTEALLNLKTPKTVKLYHGSNIQGLKYIDPKHDTFNSEVGRVDNVYTSDDPAFSACFAVKWNDDIARQGSWDNWNTVTFGISNKVDLNKPCSMYEVENDGTFTQIKTKEFICNHKVKVIKETKFKTGREMLDYYGVEVISLDEYQKRLHSNYHAESAMETEDGTLLNPTITEKFGYKSKDGLYNAIVRLKETGSHLLFRGRSEMLVIRDHKEVFLAKNDDEKYPYRLPGGSWDENEDHMYAAIRETREEARIDSTNVMYGGSYAYSLPVPKDWVTKNIPEEYQWRGYYTEVFVADYIGSYNGRVEKEDQDKNMVKTGKFYPINQVIDKLNPVQQQAIKRYLSEYNKQFKGGIKATHILASGIIRDKAGRMLLEWHNKANGLVLPSGKANPYEDPYRALVRELHEELGIIVTDATLNERSSYQAEYPVGSGNWVIFDEYNYIVNSYAGVIENKEPEKHKELTWLSESEILDEGMNLTDELYNYLDYFLHGFTGATDDTLYDAIAQFIWFSGTTTDVEWAKRVFTPEFYYKFLNEIVPFPIYTTRDIPIINIKINPYYAGLDSYYECTTNEDGYIVITLHIPYYNEKRFDFEEYIKNMLYGFTTAYLFSMFPESTESVLAFIYADYLMGRSNSGYGDTYAWGKYLFGEKEGELPQMPIDEFLDCMKYGRVDKVYEVLADNFDLKYEDLIRNQYKDTDTEKSFDEAAHLPFSINKTKLAVGTVSEILTESNTIPIVETSHLPEEAYIQIGDTVTLFEASAQDARLRQLLYNERIKQRGQLLPILAQVKEDIPEIKYAYPDIDRYKQKNLFVDLYYYNELFFRNNTWEKEKGYKLYLELLKRLINDPELKRAGYKKKTLFIPVLDWNLNKSSRMWMIRESINPISIIFNLMKMYPDDLKDTFGKMDILFFGRDKYFKINFSEIEDPKTIAIKFSNFIRKLWQGEEFDPEDEDTSQDNGSPEQIKTDLVDKIEDAKGVDLTKQIKKRDNYNKEINKKIEKDGSYTPADEPVSYHRDNKEDQPTVGQKAMEDIENDSDVKLMKDVDKDKLQQQQDDLDYIAAKIGDVADAEDVEDALERLNSDKEFKEILATISDIQDDSIKIDATRAARINKLDQDFLNSNVGGKTVKDILDSKETNKPLESTSFDIASPNEQWKNMTYVNFDKDYDLNRDIVACFYHFTKTSKPISIRSLKAEDNSTSEDRLILYTCEMEDFKGTRFTLKLDIPKMKGNRLRLRGNDKSIQNQLFNMPIIKTEPDTCQIVTNYQKIFIRTYNTVTGRSLPYAGRLIKAMKKYEGKKIKVTYGENARICIKYEVPNDYLDLAGVFTTIETSDWIIYFNQDEIREKYPDIDDSKGMPYGYNKKTKTFAYYNMEYVPFSETIARNLCDADNAFRELYMETKPSTSGVYSQCSIMSTKIPLVIVCAYTEGLTKVLKKAKINYKLTEKITPEDKDMIKDGFYSSIRFEDGYLLYETNYQSCMLLNGLDVSGCENFSMMEIDNRNTYLEMLDNYGGRIKSDGLDNFYDCLVDPISRETLEYYHLPTDFVGILLYANVLLCDNKFIKHTDMSSRRVRRTEQIAAYAYEALAESYAIYANMVKHARSKATMTIKQSAVIDKILASPISGDDSTINALEAAETTNAFSFRGKAGMNEQRSYTLDKRIYDNSMINVLGMSTSYSANVSITRQGTMNMNVDTARGYIKSINGNTEKMNAANTLAATEAVTPFGSTRDDAPRTLMTFAQTAQHTVITEDSDPMLVTNGADEMLAYTTTDKFAFKAKKDGKVIELTDEYMIIDYGDEKEYVNLSETIEKNSNGGFYTPLKLDVADKIRVGSKVKENQIVAYNKKSFSNSVGESDNIAYNNGKLAKVAILNSHECFEDSGVCSQQFAEKMATKVIDKEDHILDKDSNVFKIANIGDQVEPEDALMIWQNPHEEEEANTLLRILGNDQEMVSELGRRTVRSEITGRIADIRIYRTVEIEELSPSLQKIVKAYEKPIKEKKKKLDELGIESDFLPATYKLEPVGKLKKAQDAVLIEFYLERIDIISVGDKLTNYSANKAIIKNIIPANQMAYTDARPNEPIDLFVGQISIDKRMVTSTMNYGAIQKLLIEYDRWAKSILGIPFDDSKV